MRMRRPELTDFNSAACARELYAGMVLVDAINPVSRSEIGATAPEKRAYKCTLK